MSVAGFGIHVCEGCGAVYNTLGPYWDCLDSHWYTYTDENGDEMSVSYGSFEPCPASIRLGDVTYLCSKPASHMDEGPVNKHVATVNAEPEIIGRTPTKVTLVWGDTL